MISNLSKSIALFFYKKEIIDNDYLEICGFGFELIIATIIGFLLILVSGFLAGEVFSSILFYSVFVLVRAFTGGYHASSHLKCKTTLFFCWLFVILVYKFTIENYSFYLHNFFIIFYIVSVLLFSPVEHKNAPLTVKTRNRNRNISIIMAIALGVINIIGYRFFLKISIIVTITLFVIALLLIYPQINERRKLLYEKDN